MGTLTADIPRLDEHCSHKLPSSCRLTSTPNCCACADVRPHTSTYRKYIDGIGFVQRGVRWDHYCWFCYSFWCARVEASGLEPRQTRIPETPNQDEFTNRWFEFHQGYRVIRKPDGGEDRIAVLGEPLRDADPGHLPRTLEELRSGRAASEQIIPAILQPASQEEIQESLEETLEQMLEDAIAEEGQEEPRANGETESGSLQITSQDPEQAPFISLAERQSIRRQLEASRQEIEAEERNLETIHEILDLDERELELSRNRLIRDQRQLETFQEQVEVILQTMAHDQEYMEATEQRITQNTGRLEQCRIRLEASRQQLHASRQQQAATAVGGFARVFGTREDIQSDDYVSPITSMFMRVSEYGRRNRPQSGRLAIQEDYAESQTRRQEVGEYVALLQETPVVELEVPPSEQLEGQSIEQNSRHEVLNAPSATSPNIRDALQTERVFEQATEVSRTTSRLRRRLRAFRQSPQTLHPPQDLDFPERSTEMMANIFRAIHLRLGGLAGESLTPLTDWVMRIPLHNVTISPPTLPIHSVITRITMSTQVLSMGEDPDWENLLTELARVRSHLSADGWDPDLAEIACNAIRSAYDEGERYLTRNIRDHNLFTEVSTAVRVYARSNSHTLLCDMEDHLNSAILEGARRSRDNHPPRNPDHTFAYVPFTVDIPRTVETIPSAEQGLDITDDRPEPKSDEDMVAKVECKICLTQVADTACLPCGHLSMCHWCANQTIPTKKEDRTRPIRKGLKCPVCRENVKSRVKIFVL